MRLGILIEGTRDDAITSIMSLTGDMGALIVKDEDDRKVLMLSGEHKTFEDGYPHVLVARGQIVGYIPGTHKICVQESPTGPILEVAHFAIQLERENAQLRECLEPKRDGIIPYGSM